MKNTLKFLGRGSYFNEEEPNNSAYFKQNENLLLIDCGNGVCSKIKELNLLNNVKNVYVAITHIHKDHIIDLPNFVRLCHDYSIMPNIIKTQAINEKVLLGQPQYDASPYAEFIGCHLGLVEGKDYKLVSSDDRNLCQFVQLNSFVVPHMEPLISCCFFLKLGGKKIFYSGDCNKLDLNLRGFDEYYFECSQKDPLNVHLSLSEVKNIMENNEIEKNKVYLMHIESTKAAKLFKEQGFKVAKLERIKKEPELNNV